MSKLERKRQILEEIFKTMSELVIAADTLTKIEGINDGRNYRKKPELETIRKPFMEFLEKFNTFKKIAQPGFWFSFQRKIKKEIFNQYNWEYIKILIKYYDDYCRSTELFLNGNHPYRFGFGDRDYQIKKFAARYFNRIKKELILLRLSAQKWDIAKKVMARKSINIFRRDLIIHNTYPPSWTKKAILRFIKVGLLCPNLANSINKGGWGESNFPWNISFFLTGKDTNHYSRKRGMAFILDPEWVYKNGRNFRYFPHIMKEDNDYAREHNAKERQISAKLGVTLINNYDMHVQGLIDEVLGPRQIPIMAIRCMIIDPVYKDISIRLMAELIDYDPELAFPVYYPNGELVPLES